MPAGDEKPPLPFTNYLLGRDGTPSPPLAIALQPLDGGANLLVSFSIFDQARLAKFQVFAFRLFYLSARVATQTQVSAANLDGTYFTLFAKALPLADVPVSGQILQEVIPGSLISAGGWITAAGVNPDHGSPWSFHTAWVPIPTTSTLTAVPSDVTNPQVSLVNFKIGRTYYDWVNIAYQAPAPLGTFAYCQIYVWNYQNDNQLREGPVFSYNGAPGGQGVGKFLLECDDNPVNVFSAYVAITNATNATPIVITTASAHGLSSGATVTIFDVGGNLQANGTWIITVLTSTTFSLNTSSGSGSYTTGGTMVSVGGSKRVGIAIPPHDVILYFVALSTTHNHRYDFGTPGGPPVVTRGRSPILNKPIPSVRLIGGIITMTTPPIAPEPSGVVLGSKVQLTWQEINDENIDHVNIYRANQGKFLSPVTNQKPQTPFKVVSKEILNTGTNTWVDADFNDYRGGDVQYSPLAPTPTLGDFTVQNPTLFQYWMTAVNDAGQESVTPQTTGTLILRGVDGTDTNPAATYRDNIFNCVWNSQFNSNTTTTAKPVTAANQPRTPLTDAAGSSYGKWIGTVGTTGGTVLNPGNATFVSNGTIGTGEIDIPAPATTTLGDFERIDNDSPLDIFLNGESLVFSVVAGWTGSDPTCDFVLGGVYSTGAGSADGTIVSQIDFPGSALMQVPANYARFVVYSVMPAAGSANHLRYVVGLRLNVGGSATGKMRVKQPMINGGTEVANWTATVRDQDAPGGGGGGGGGGTGGGGNPPPNTNPQCVLEGTMIQTQRGPIAVENVKRGDFILSPTYSGFGAIGKVRRIVEGTTGEIWGIGCAGKTLWCSPSHPILVKGRFFVRLKKANRIRPGDLVATWWTTERHFMRVANVGVAYGVKMKIYGIEMDGKNPFYVSDGLISHNKRFSS